MAGMSDALSPNPDGCTEFSRHQFKKERCKNCGKRWQEHLGVIDDGILNEFLCAQKEAEERRRKAEEEKKAKEAKAKELARQKRRSQRAPDPDDWFYSDGKGGGSDSEPEGADFKMLEGNALPTKLDSHRSNVSSQPTVKNLIDFSECNVSKTPESIDKPASNQVKNITEFSECNVLKTPESIVKPASIQAEPTDPKVGNVHVEETAYSNPTLSTLPDENPRPEDSYMSQPGSILSQPSEEALLVEIELLRQRLSDADMERTLQLSIVLDQVEEKQRVIEELEQKRLEMEGKLAEALVQVESLRQERDAAALAATAAAEAAAAQEAAQQQVPLEPVEPSEATETETITPPSEPAGAEALQLQCADESDPRVQPRSRNGIVGKLLEQRFWLTCLHPGEVSDGE